MLAALQRKYHLVDEVVDVEQLEFDRRVADMNRKSIGNVVAESGYGRVIVGTAPLTEEVRETVYEYFRVGFRSIVEEKFFSGLLAFAVWMPGIATYQSSLNGAAQHYRTCVAVLAERVEQCRGKAEVALAEVFGILGAVYTCEIKYEIGLPAVAVEFLGRRIDVVFKDRLDFHGIVFRLAVLDVIELGTEIAAYKAFGARY